MKILVIGSGGREHALVWKLRQSPRVTEIFCAPGNGGISQIAECVPLKISDHDALVKLAKERGIGLTIVGPDDALAAGIADRFQSEGLRIFGPTQSAARLESSKVFAKEFMLRHGIPTAASGQFSNADEARAFAAKMSAPIVVKASGLALGKGVIIAETHVEADAAIREIMEERKFGEAGAEVVIEEFLLGEECSIHALVDGRSYLLFPSAQDHKRALDGDRGLNTGGMGTFSPASKVLPPALEQRVRTEVLDHFIAGLRADGLDYRGMLFPGIMITRDGIKVLEFNCRSSSSLSASAASCEESCCGADSADSIFLSRESPAAGLLNSVAGVAGTTAPFTVGGTSPFAQASASMAARNTVIFMRRDDSLTVPSPQCPNENAFPRSGFLRPPRMRAPLLPRVSGRVQ